jgi:hypothetical protein
MERKQVEGEPLFDSWLVGFFVRGLAFPFLISFLSLAIPGLRTALGHAAEWAEAL